MTAGPCACSGGTGVGDVRQRPDYGVRCGRWDSADEDPWCVVAAAACGTDTFQSSSGHYWAHRPCPADGVDGAVLAAVADNGGDEGSGAASTSEEAVDCAAIGAELELAIEAATPAAARAARRTMERVADGCARVHTIALDLAPAALDGGQLGTAAAAAAAVIAAGSAVLDVFLGPRFEWSFVPWDYSIGGANGGGSDDVGSGACESVLLTRKYRVVAELSYRRALQTLQAPPNSTAGASPATLFRKHGFSWICHADCDRC